MLQNHSVLEVIGKKIGQHKTITKAKENTITQINTTNSGFWFRYYDKISRGGKHLCNQPIVLYFADPEMLKYFAKCWNKYHKVFVLRSNDFVNSPSINKNIFFSLLIVSLPTINVKHMSLDEWKIMKTQN